MAEFYKSNMSKFHPLQSAAIAAANQQAQAAIAQKLPDVNAIVHSCDEMLKIAAHTREKAKLLQKQIGELGRASLQRQQRRCATANALQATANGNVVGANGPAAGAVLNPVDSELHQIRITAGPKQMINSSTSSSATSLSDSERLRPQSVQAPKLKNISTINSHSARVATTTTTTARGRSNVSNASAAAISHSKAAAQRRAVLANQHGSAPATNATAAGRFVARRPPVQIPRRQSQQVAGKVAGNNQKNANTSTSLAAAGSTAAAGGGATLVTLLPTAGQMPGRSITQTSVATGGGQPQQQRVTSANSKQQQQQQAANASAGCGGIVSATITPNVATPTQHSPKTGRNAR